MYIYLYDFPHGIILREAFPMLWLKIFIFLMVLLKFYW